MVSKAVFIDVDGTLVNHRGLVPPSARAAVVAARANGHQVFLATGRSMSELWAEILEPGFDGVIAAAGGYIEYEGEVLAHQHIAVDDVRHAVDYFGRHRVSYLLETNNGIYGSPRAKHRLRELIFGPVTDEDVLAEMERGLGGFIDSLVVDDEPVRADVNKISFLDCGLPLQAIRAEFAGVFDVIPATVPMFGAASGEMSIPGVHKAAAIDVLIGHAGIAREDTIAFGDGANDLQMLRYVHIGVAMGDATASATQAADRTTTSVDEDGLLLGFRDLGLI